MENKTVEKKDKSGVYYIYGAIITGIILFFCVWIYSFSEWGLLFGLLFGWVPALIAAVIGGLIWPILAILVVYIVLNMF